MYTVRPKSACLFQNLAFNIERRCSDSHMEQGPLTVAQILKTTILSRLVGMKYDSHFPNEFLKSRVNRSEDYRRVSPGGVEVLPTLLQAGADGIDANFRSKNVIQIFGGINECCPHALGPVDRAPQTTAHKGRHLGDRVSRCRDVQHLNTSPVYLLKIDTILFFEIAEFSYSPQFPVDGAFQRPVIGQRRL